MDVLSIHEMKTKLIVWSLATCVVLLITMGCNKDSASTQSPPAAQKTEGVASDVSKAVDTAKSTAQQVTDTASAQVKGADQQAQGLIDKAKGLLADQKYQDALSTLNQLATANLTADQQKLVADLKTQIQNALSKVSASDAASTLGGALGGKK
jgi:hypothetical protein